MTRMNVVNVLVDEALDGFTHVPVASAAEMFSASLTLVLRMMKTAKKLGTDLEAFRPGLMLLYSELPPQKTAELN